jgi:hypothetical protein
MEQMLSLATKLTALLIAFIFLGATAQCVTACIQPEAAPVCHHHNGDKDHQACIKPALTADHIHQAETPVPTLTELKFDFAPVICTRELAQQPLSPVPFFLPLETTVLLI